VISEEDNCGTLSKTYVHDPGKPIGTILADVSGADANGTWRYYFQDNIGSTRRLRDGNKASLAYYEYEPYGGEYTKYGADSTRYEFTGKEWDATAQLYYFPFRYYAPSVARWITREPSGIDGPNLYCYALGMPVSYADLTGLWTAQVGGTAQAGTAVTGGVGASGGLICGYSRKCGFRCGLYGTVGGGGYTWGAGAGGEVVWSSAESIYDIAGVSGQVGASVPVPVIPGSPNVGVEVNVGSSAISYGVSATFGTPIPEGHGFITQTWVNELFNFRGLLKRFRGENGDEDECDPCG